jgi:hypothetical protein
MRDNYGGFFKVGEGKQGIEEKLIEISFQEAQKNPLNGGQKRQF